MVNKKLEINYSEYSSHDELLPEEKNLLDKAIEATKRSYSPYSGFSVGAALLLEDGTVVTGSNQENIAYPSGLCAERTALFAAGATYPERAVTAIAISSAKEGKILDDIASPCGACRQVMAETQMRYGRKIKIILGGFRRVLIFNAVDDLLPFIFDSTDVNRVQ